MSISGTPSVGFTATRTRPSDMVIQNIRRTNEVLNQPTTLTESIDPTSSFRKSTDNQYNHFRGFLECVRGSVRPFVNMAKNPVKTAIGVGAVALLCATPAAPFVIGGLALAGGTMGTVGFVRSARRAGQARQRGDIQGAYQEIRNMGASATGIAASVATAGQIKSPPTIHFRNTGNNLTQAGTQVARNFSGVDNAGSLASAVSNTASQAARTSMPYLTPQATISDGQHLGNNLYSEV